MKLTAFTDYSLRVLIYLATSPERRSTIAEISSAFDINANHLTKVVHHLGKKGWVETTRGKGGGLTLAPGSSDVRVGTIVRDTEGVAEPAECFATESTNCAIVSCCRLKGVLGEAVNAFYAVLDKYSVADLTKNREALSGILHFHQPSAVQ